MYNSHRNLGELDSLFINRQQNAMGDVSLTPSWLTNQQIFYFEPIARVMCHTRTVFFFKISKKRYGMGDFIDKIDENLLHGDLVWTKKILFLKEFSNGWNFILLWKSYFYLTFWVSCTSPVPKIFWPYPLDAMNSPVVCIRKTKMPDYQIPSSFEGPLWTIV